MGVKGNYPAQKKFATFIPVMQFAKALIEHQRSKQHRAIPNPSFRTPKRNISRISPRLEHFPMIPKASIARHFRNGVRIAIGKYRQRLPPTKVLHCGMGIPDIYSTQIASSFNQYRNDQAR